MPTFAVVALSLLPIIFAVTLVVISDRPDCWVWVVLGGVVGALLLLFALLSAWEPLWGWATLFLILSPNPPIEA